MKLFILAFLVFGVQAGDDHLGSGKLRTSYPASRNLLGNIYETKRPHELYKVEHTYPAAVAPFHDRLEAASYAPHGYAPKGVYAHGYGPSFNLGREVAYNHGDLIYPDRLYGRAVDGDHGRYFRYPGLAYKGYNHNGYAKNNVYASGSANLGFGRKGYAAIDDGHKGYGSKGYGYAQEPVYKGYGYAQELPTIGGVGHVTKSKATGFLYKGGRYIGHGSPYVPYTAAPYKQIYRDQDLHAVDDYYYAGIDHGYAGLNHGYAGLNHGYAGINHGYAGINNGYAGLNHANAGLDHGSAGLNHGYAGLNHGYAGLNHANAGLNHGYAGINHGYSGINHGHANL